jgi:hypothetical protein
MLQKTCRCSPHCGPTSRAKKVNNRVAEHRQHLESTPKIQCRHTKLTLYWAQAHVLMRHPPEQLIAELEVWRQHAFCEDFVAALRTVESTS